MKNLYLTLFAIFLLAVTTSGQITSTTGSFVVCVGETTALTDTFGGTWSIYPTSIATISTTGSVTGVTAGTATVTYVGPGGSSSTAIMTVNPAPTPITGLSTVCVGSTISLSGTPTGGMWVSDPIAVAMVGSGTGIVTGLTPGTTTITYHTPAGCIPTMQVTVYPVPAAIGGSGTVCVGATTTLTSAPGSGTWSSLTTSIATIDGPTGAMTGVSPGTATIQYILVTTGCYSSRIVTVNPLPAAITGPLAICDGGTGTMSCTTSGGTWSSDIAPVAIFGTSNVVYGVAPGTATISYTVGTGCSSTRILTVHPMPSTITGPSALCTGATGTLSSATGGGTWSSSIPSVASIASSTGVATGVSAGTTMISYILGTGCSTTTVLTVDPGPGAISGTTGFCVGGTTSLSIGMVGGSWSSASPTITVGAATGIVSATAAGTATITYTLSSGCFSTTVVTASATPTITVTPIALTCSPNQAYVATGAGLYYSWTPAPLYYLGSGFTDTAAIYADGTTYTVTGTTAGCSGTTTFTATVPNRILGHLSFSGPAPSGTSARVWLIQFNPTDSSITAQDSMLTCLDGSNPYYQFDSKPAGSYLVKAKLTSSVAGTSDYLPTYGASSATWDVATPVTHTSGSDSLHIAMLYGTVPSGPGFISGYVYMGAGKGTSGEVPAAHMIVYLKNAAGTVLTYTYTDGSGAYSFSGLGYGSYVIYPEEMSYYTIPSSVITLSAGTPSVGAIGFKKRTTVGTIEPWAIPGAVMPMPATAVELYPNPASDMVMITNASGMHITITDVTGSEVYNTFASQAQQTINIANLPGGVYMVVASGNGQVQRFRLVKE